MEGGSSSKISANSTDEAPMSELRKMQKQHDEKLARVQELKGKKEAMILELERKKNENPEKMKEFDDLTDKYNSRKGQFLALMAEKMSHGNNK